MMAAAAALFNLNFFRSIFVRRFIYHDLARSTPHAANARPACFGTANTASGSITRPSRVPCALRARLSGLCALWRPCCLPFSSSDCPRSLLSFSQSANCQVEVASLNEWVLNAQELQLTRRLFMHKLDMFCSLRYLHVKVSFLI